MQTQSQERVRTKAAFEAGLREIKAEIKAQRRMVLEAGRQLQMVLEAA